MKPIRMCIACKKRIEQNKLIRLQCINKEMVKFTGIGRSFYICRECMFANEKNLIKSLVRFCKNDKKTMLKTIEKFKENIFNG